jgi:hypothetical protein
VYGKDNNEYLISDPVFEAPVRCAEQDLQKSRFAKGALAPKGLMYFIEKIPESINFEKAITSAIRANTRSMQAPFPIIGLRGIRFLARKLKDLKRNMRDDRKIKLYIGHIVRMQEEIGTGGAGFRFIYASFLQEAGNMLNSPVLLDASSMMTTAGDQWRTFALEAVKMCKGRSEMDLNYLSDLLYRCASEEEKVWKFLKAAKCF